jgi:hypothetical protein
MVRVLNRFKVMESGRFLALGERQKPTFGALKKDMSL